MHAITVTRLRSDLYKVIDEVIKTGIPVEIDRNGKKVQIVAVEPKLKLDNLIKRPEVIIGDPETLVHIDWLEHWKEEANL